jgi:hypothetical protein
MYQPDNWVVIKFPDHYRVLAGWSGGYLTGDSWKLNSGIVRVEDDGENYLFYGSSGSCYKCCKSFYCLRKNNVYVYESLKQKYGDKVGIMPEDTDWLNVDWRLQ